MGCPTLPTPALPAVVLVAGHPGGLPARRGHGLVAQLSKRDVMGLANCLRAGDPLTPVPLLALVPGLVALSGGSEHWCRLGRHVASGGVYHLVCFSGLM